MKGKLIVVIALVLAIIVATVLYFTKTENTFFKDTSLFSAVPVSVPVFIEVASLKAVPSKNAVIEQFAGLEKIGVLTGWIEKLDSIIQENSEIQNGLRNEPFIAALGFMGEKNLTPLFIQKAESSSRQRSIANLARALYPETENTYTEIDYTGYKITSVT